VHIGLVTLWSNRGQAVVMRQLRSILDAAGHETSVLARPTRDTFDMPAVLESSGEWSQPAVTRASGFRPSCEELVAWAYRHRCEVVLFFMYKHWAGVDALRRRGIRTVGTFMWERFSQADAERAGEAYDEVFALTESSAGHFAALGLPSTRVRYGVHPDLMRARSATPRSTRAPREEIRLLYQASVEAPRSYGELGVFARKPLRAVVEAFAATTCDRLRLLVKTQTRYAETDDLDAMDRRVRFVTQDVPRAEYDALVEGSDALVAVTRWEGLGVPLYEAAATGLPVLANDLPPLNEVVEHDVNGLLCANSRVLPVEGTFAIHEPDPTAMTRMFDACADAELLRRLAAGMRETRDRLSWEHTTRDVEDLVSRLR
jgi:glycosyltransferase involved in cell wall biosynthesis